MRPISSVFAHTVLYGLKGERSKEQRNGTQNSLPAERTQPMPEENRVVVCGKHAERFGKIAEHVNDGESHVIVKQFWRAPCGCEVEITATSQKLEKGN